MVSVGFQGTAESCLEGDGGHRSGSGGLEPQSEIPVYWDLMTAFPLII